MSSNGKNDADKVAKERAQEQESYRLQCNQYVESGLQSNVTIQFLIDRLVGMGCAPPKGFIKCMDCGDKMAGGGFGVVEETVVESATLTEVAERAKVEQCHRTEEDLKKQLGNVTTCSCSCMQLSTSFLLPPPPPPPLPTDRHSFVVCQ